MTTSNNSAPAKKDALTWFEIPVRDMDRAQKFYEAILHASLRREPMGTQELAIFPYQEPGVGGALLLADYAQPSGTGTLVYINVIDQGSIQQVLDRVGPAGGSVAMPTMSLPDGMGMIAHVVDTEGNRVGLHAMQ